MTAVRVTRTVSRLCWNETFKTFGTQYATSDILKHLRPVAQSFGPHRRVLLPLCADAAPRIVESIPRIVEVVAGTEGISGRVPLTELKDAPEAVLRQAASLQQNLSPDRVGWPFLILGAVALAIIAEVALKVKDRMNGVVRGSQSERREVQATRRQDNAFPTGGARDQSPEAAYRRQVMYVDRFEERNRGLLWLAAVTAAILGIAGWFNPNASQPFLF